MMIIERKATSVDRFFTRSPYSIVTMYTQRHSSSFSKTNWPAQVQFAMRTFHPAWMEKSFNHSRQSAGFTIH